MSDKGLSEEDVAAACKDADPMTKVRPNISLNASHRNFCHCQTEAGRQLQLHQGADRQLRVVSCSVFMLVCLFYFVLRTAREKAANTFKTAVRRHMGRDDVKLARCLWVLASVLLNLHCG